MRVFLFFHFFWVGHLFSQEFESYADCQYYLDLNHKKGCYHENYFYSQYFVRYGYKYCKRFQSSSEKWPLPLKKWAIQTSHCLIHELKKYEETQYNCKTLEKIAYKSHVYCYQMAGFCSLSSFHQSVIISSIDKKDIIFQPFATGKQGLSLFFHCGLP